MSFRLTLTLSWLRAWWQPLTKRESGRRATAGRGQNEQGERGNKRREGRRAGHGEGLDLISRPCASLRR